ncbi:MAG: hypothetical protein AB8H86_00225 [Polyangiales bacterium]
MQAGIVALVLLLGAPLWGDSFGSTASAQDAQQRQGAADAYDRGSAAFLAEDYAAAGRWFETANRLAPAAPALLQAIRAHRRAGDDVRAGTLSLRLMDTYEGNAAAEAEEVIRELSPSLVRVDIVCSECAVQVDGSLALHDSFFVTPDEEHNVVLGFSTGDVERTVSGEAGERLPVTASAPIAMPNQRIDDGGTTNGNGSNLGTGGTNTPRREESGGISPALFVTSLVLTVGAGATLVWSGIDTQNDAEVYERVAVQERDLVRARELLAAGQKEETRTNVLIGVTSGLAVLTVVFAIMTDWGGDEEDESASVTLRPTLGGGVDHGSVGLQGSF